MVRHTDGYEQRTRILRAAERVLCEHGVDVLGVGEVCRATGCSRSTFYTAFRNRDDLLLALFDELTRRVGRAMADAYHEQSVWEDGVRAALFELLAFFDAAPTVARFLVIGSLTGDRRLLEQRGRMLETIASVLAADTPPAPIGSPAPFGAEALVGAVASILHARLLEDPAPLLCQLCPPLMGVIVLPHLGAQAAREELERALPSHVARASLTIAGNGPSHARTHRGLRVTHRTIGVLSAIAERPKMSNSEIASAAGIVDQGQISRLLARLRRLGLVETDGSAEERGRRKEWSVTASGLGLLAEVGRAPGGPARGGG